MRILYLTYDISWPPSFGGEIRRWNILQGLLQAGDTDAIVFRSGGRPIAKEPFAGCARILEVKECDPGFNKRRQRLYDSTVGRGVLTLGSALPFEYQGIYSQSRLQLDGSIDFCSYDVVWFATLRVVMSIGTFDARVSILDGDDFGYVREWLLLRSSPWYGAKIWNYLDVAKLWWLERSLMRRFAVVVRCSQADRDRHPACNVVVIPNGAVVPSTITRTVQRRVLFVGYLSYAPNFQGLEWFLNFVWPLIRREVPDAVLDIVGKNPPSCIRQAHGQSGIAVHGYVNDLSSLYETAAVSVVPLHAGSGTRLKILESVANGVPVVSTELGALGINATEQHGVYRANARSGFANHCVTLLRNTERDRLRENAGRDFVRFNYNWRLIQRQVTDLVDRVTKSSMSTHVQEAGSIVKFRRLGRVTRNALRQRGV
jgi:polysaccharide biosynthesis protein PslH